MPRHPLFDPQLQPGGQATLPRPVDDATQHGGHVDPDGPILGQAEPHTSGEATDIRPTPRCGVPDSAAGGLRPTAYGPPGGRWSRGNLTYTADASGSRLLQSVVDAQVAKAF